MPREIGPRQGPYHTVDEFPSPEKDECGGAVDPVLGWGHAVLIDVQENELHPSRINRCQLIENRGYSLAVDAEGRVELREHRSLESEDFPGKSTIGGGHGMIGKEAWERKRGLAATAHGPIVPPPAYGYSVLRPAMGTPGYKKIRTHRGNILAPSERVNVPVGPYDQNPIRTCQRSGGAI
jgi:hypothetical protein